MFSYISDIAIKDRQRKIQDKFIIFDVQGIFIANKFHAKEICISVSDYEIRTFIISTIENHSELTRKDEVANKWLYKNFHGLHWNKGDSTLEDMIKYLKKALIQQKMHHYSVIYVKGVEKMKWLTEILKQEIRICVINLDDLNCPNVRTLYQTNTNINICRNHYNSSHICAGKNVILFRNFVNSILKKHITKNQ